MTKAYSYVRFSTPDQLRGDSQRRQTEAAQKYADEHGLELDTELVFHDLGVSAYRGANLDGALGRFIEAVDNGTVPKGSVLLVENLDRLSRDKIRPALNRFGDLLDKGVSVVTLQDGKRYDAASLDNLPDLMLSLLVMTRAHEESQTKSRRGKAAWQAKRKQAAEGKALTRKCPAWLQYDPAKGRFNLIPERAAVVRNIYKMALEGHGYGAIVNKLKTSGVAPFTASDGWHYSYVRRILTNPAVIGVFQPGRDLYVDGKRRREQAGEPIEGYYPAVIDPETYYRVKHGKPGVSGKKGRPLANRLSGLVYCAICGGRLHWVNKGKPPKGKQYLACDNARRKKTCHAKSVRYDVVWASVLAAMDRPQLAIMFGANSDGRKAELANKIAALDGLIAEADQSIENLLNILQRRLSGVVEQRLAEQEQALAGLRAEREALDTQLQSEPTGEDWTAVLETLERDLAGTEANVRWNANLKRIIDRVDVGLFNFGYWLAVDVYFHGADEPVKAFSSSVAKRPSQRLPAPPKSKLRTQIY